MKTIFKLSGSIFVLATSLLFYISLYVASFSDFRVILDFNHYGEGLIELIIFSLIIPFILYSVYTDIKLFTSQSKSLMMHPYTNYPLKFRKFFNNFMMSKTGNDTIDGMNWARDVKLYNIEGAVEKAGLQLPSFSMAKEVFEKHGYAPESDEKETLSFHNLF